MFRIINNFLLNHRIAFIAVFMLLVFSSNVGCENGSKKSKPSPSGSVEEEKKKEEEKEKEKEKEEEEEEEDKEKKIDEKKSTGLEAFLKKYDFEKRSSVSFICNMRTRDLRKILKWADRGRGVEIENFITDSITASAIDISSNDIDAMLELLRDGLSTESKVSELRGDCSKVMEEDED